MSTDRPPLPPFTRETAIQKVRAAEAGWNSCSPERVSLVYTADSRWRNRSEFLQGRPQIVESRLFDSIILQILRGGPTVHVSEF
jgi:nuclear transport factor 2 (NTF2) superfamily protein